MAAKADPDVTEDGWHAAMLHDVVEDTGTTLEDLGRLGYSDRTNWLVGKLTRDTGIEDYQTWIRTIADTGDRELITIKLADNHDNSDPGRIARLPEGQRGVSARYGPARQTLMAALGPPKATGPSAG